MKDPETDASASATRGSGDGQSVPQRARNAPSPVQATQGLSPRSAGPETEPEGRNGSAPFGKISGKHDHAAAKARHGHEVKRRGRRGSGRRAKGASLGDGTDHAATQHVTGQAAAAPRIGAVRPPIAEPASADSAAGRGSATSGNRQDQVSRGPAQRGKNIAQSSSKRRRKRVAAPGRDQAASAELAPKQVEAEAGDKAAQKRRRKRKRGRKVFAKDMAQARESAASADSGASATPDRMGRTPLPMRNASPQMRSGLQSQASLQNAGRQHGNLNASRDTGRLNGGSGMRRTHPPVYAALDLGTNNCRLLMAVPTRGGRFRVVDAFSRIVRLGEGVSSSGKLGDAAMTRAVEALKVCADKLKSRNVRRARLIATEACRSALNGQDFLERVKLEAGLDLEVIDRQTEARLAVSGCASLIEADTDAVVLFDIGGGSSEIALVDLSKGKGPKLARNIVAWTSLPVGVVSLAERFGGRDVTPEIFEAMIGVVVAMLDEFPGRDKLGELVHSPRFHLLGTSGTVTTLAGVHLGLQRYDRRRVDGLWMDRVNVDAMVETIKSWDFDARVANPCIGQDRADLVLAGCAILEGIRRIWPAEKIRVADRGLREGILSELMGDDSAWRRLRAASSQNGARS